MTLAPDPDLIALLSEAADIHQRITKRAAEVVYDFMTRQVLTHLDTGTERAIAYSYETDDQLTTALSQLPPKLFDWHGGLSTYRLSRVAVAKYLGRDPEKPTRTLHLVHSAERHQR